MSSFFNCLEQNNILDAIKDDDKSKAACGALNQEFERSCATAWVSVLPQIRIQSPEVALAKLSDWSG